MLLPLGSDPDLRFHLFTRNPEAVPSTLRVQPSIVVHALPRAPAFWIDQQTLPARAAALECDLFYSPYYKGPLTTTLPLVITVHDITFLRLPLLPRYKRALIGLYLRAAVGRAARIVVVSRFTERDLIDCVPKAKGKTVVLYSDMGQDWCERLAACRTSGDPPVSPEPYVPYFLYVGNFKPHKNVDSLVRGYAIARESGRLHGLNLVLVGGDDANAPRIERLVSQLNLQDSVHILRDLDDDSLVCFYHRARWFVTASKYEGFGYPCVEAMVAGCPVIYHPATSLMEVVGGAGLQIPEVTPSEIAATLIEAAELPEEERRRYINAGRRQARLFTPGESARAFGVLCRKIAEEHRGRRV